MLDHFVGGVVVFLIFTKATLNVAMSVVTFIKLDRIRRIS